MRISILLGAALLILSGCTKANKGGGFKVLLPWQTTDGHYHLREVTLTTLSSPFELKGQAAEVYYNGALSSDGYHGQVAHPRVTKSGDVYVPMDVPSSLALTMYANYEFIYKFEKKLGTLNQLSWPRKVGVEVQFVGASNTDNAHYFPTVDSTAFLPYDEQGKFDRIPLAVNSGVIAHEHFHAHFQREVIDQLEKQVGVQALDSGHWKYNDVVSANNFIVRGWNEGLADLFGAIYSGSPEFLSESFPASMPGVADRALDQPERQFISLDYFMAQVSAASVQGFDPAGPAYVQGTTLARLMYAIANSGIETPNEFLAHVMAQLHKLGQALAPVYATQVLQPEAIVPILLEGVPLNAAVCADLRATLNPETMQGSFSACAGS